VVAELQKAYTPFFLVPDHQRSARCEKAWRDLLGDNLLVMEARWMSALWRRRAAA
jgi:hypothetical protein